MFRVLSVCPHGGNLAVHVQHLNPDGSPWFTWYYLWQGREGDVHKRVKDAYGRFVLDDGTVASTEPGPPDAPERRRPVLPVGRKWTYHPEPWMDAEAVLSAVRRVHMQATVEGWAQGLRDTLPATTGVPEDVAGVATLVTTFQHLVGREG